MSIVHSHFLQKSEFHLHKKTWMTGKGKLFLDGELEGKLFFIITLRLR